MSPQENTPEPTVLGNQIVDQRPKMLGTMSTGQRPLYKEEEARRRRDITVRVSFEAHRLATTYVATAYEQLVPLRRRGRRAAAEAAPADQRAGERVGA